MFQKYKIEKLLKNNENSEVILVFDREEKCKRIIKKILKDGQGEESLQAEILLLKHLDREEVPKLCDVKENGDYIYIIEEYIEGRTLWEIIRSDGPFCLRDAVFYSRQLADIIVYLHSIKPDAVLHLDIQPKNIIIHSNRLYLIDFGNAAYANEVTERKYFKGTPGFAAPEQYTGENLGKWTDLYGAGACMAYMVTGMQGKEAFCKTDGYIKEIIQGCTMLDPALRYPSAEFLREKLGNTWIFFKEETEERIRREEKYREDNVEKERRTVLSFAGTQSRVGTTRIALEFTKYLVEQGGDAGYQESHDGNLISRLLKEDKNISYAGGEFCYHGIKLRPSYHNTGISLDYQHEIIVSDEGVFSESMTVGGILIMVAGVSSWEMGQTRLMARMVEKYQVINRETKVIWLWNLVGGKEKEKYIRELGLSGFVVPFFNKYMKMENPHLFHRLLEEIGLRAGKRKG